MSDKKLMSVILNSQSDAFQIFSVKDFVIQNISWSVHKLLLSNYMIRFTIFCQDFLVKPLCVHLDYLLPNAPEKLHLQQADPTGFLTSFEGGRGSLELLHACPE